MISFNNRNIEIYFSATETTLLTKCFCGFSGDRVHRGSCPKDMPPKEDILGQEDDDIQVIVFNYTHFGIISHWPIIMLLTLL